MASGKSLEERRETPPPRRVYGCARCGRGTTRTHIPGLSTALANVPCTLVHPEGQSCTGAMLVHLDPRVCDIVRRAAART